MLRRTLATAAVTAIAVVGLAPAASAQLGDLNAVVSDGIANARCQDVDPILKTVFDINADTTRSDLARQIRDEAKSFTLTDPTTYLVSAQFAEQIADKAVECGTVKPDPEFFPGSSIPDVNNLQDLLQGLSAALTN